MNKTIRLTESDLHRVVKESVKKIFQERYDTLGQSIDDFAYDHDSDFAKTIFSTMNAIEDEMKKYDGYEDDDWDKNSGRNYQCLSNAYKALEQLIYNTNADI